MESVIKIILAHFLANTDVSQNALYPPSSYPQSEGGRVVRNVVIRVQTLHIRRQKC